MKRQKCMGTKQNKNKRNTKGQQSIMKITEQSKKNTNIQTKTEKETKKEHEKA